MPTMALTPVRPPVVTGVLVVHDGAGWLKECLNALSLQRRPPDRLVIVDTGSADESLRLIERHARIRQVVGDVSTIFAPQETTFGEAVRRAVELMPAERPAPEAASPEAPSSEAVPAHFLWLLHDDSAAGPEALAELLDAVTRSPSVGIAGPKLVTWEDPTRLLELGTVITRAGRRTGGPVRGEPDQGQHDHRYDVLGVSTSGMLIRRDVYDTLGGFDPAFGQFRDDLDLCWRAQLAGHRVVVAPKARMREAAASINGRRGSGMSVDSARSRDLRHGRQVALARCSLFAAPVLAVWIALASLCSAAFLLVAKRPRSAWAALGDLGALVTPWRPMAARWRARGLRRIRRRDLRALFASPRTTLGYAWDTIHQGAPLGFDRSADDAGRGWSAELGLDSREAELLEAPLGRTRWRTLGHPGLLAVAAAALLSAITWRSLWATLSPSSSGVAGGELLPVGANSSGLWHSWLDGWHGPGMGSALEPAPYLPVLSAGAWVIEHLPIVDASASPVGVATAWLLAAATPLSAWTAYVGARVVIRAPWPRAWAALAWASLATLTVAVSSGRLGAVVAHVLLPCIAAGFVCAMRRSARVCVIFGAALALGVAGAFNPTLAALGAAAALLLLVVGGAGGGRTRLRALVLLLVPVGLLGPWVLRLVDNPMLLLAGPGLTVWPGGATSPWQPGLWPPEPGFYLALAAAPIVLAGIVAMSRRGAGSRTGRTLALLGAGLLAVLGVAAPHLAIGLASQDLAAQNVVSDLPVPAGGSIAMWAGTALDVAALVLIAAALRGLDDISRTPSPTRHCWRRRVIVPALVTTAVLGTCASMVLTGWFGLGQVLAPLVPDLPAVAAEQAHGPLGSRLLELTRGGDGISYRLLGSEPGPVVRDLPGPQRPPEPVVASAVARVVGTAGVAPTRPVRDVLADLGVGFVAFRGPSTVPLVTALDASEGLVRLGSRHGAILWRVRPRDASVASSRLRIVDLQGVPLQSVPVTGDHARTSVRIGPATGPNPAVAPPAGAPAAVSPPSGRLLVVAEPQQWTGHALVSFDGRPLTAVAGARQPTYQLPATAGQLRITVLPSQQWWRWGQLGLLVLVIFLAAPFGSSRDRRNP